MLLYPHFFTVFIVFSIIIYNNILLYSFILSLFIWIGITNVQQPLSSKKKSKQQLRLHTVTNVLMRQARSEVYSWKAGVLRLTQFQAPARRVGRLNPARRHAVIQQRSRLTNQISRALKFLLETKRISTKSIVRIHNATRVTSLPIIELSTIVTTITYVQVVYLRTVAIYLRYSFVYRNYALSLKF